MQANVFIVEHASFVCQAVVVQMLYVSQQHAARV